MNGAIVSSHQVVEFTGSSWAIQTGENVPAPEPGSASTTVNPVASTSSAWVYSTQTNFGGQLDELGTSCLAF